MKDPKAVNAYITARTNAQEYFDKLSAEDKLILPKIKNPEIFNAYLAARVASETASANANELFNKFRPQDKPLIANIKDPSAMSAYLALSMAGDTDSKKAKELLDNVHSMDRFILSSRDSKTLSAYLVELTSAESAGNAAKDLLTKVSAEDKLLLSAIKHHKVVSDYLTNSRNEREFISSVPAQDKLITAAVLGDPKIVDIALQEGANVHEFGSVNRGMTPAPALFLTLYYARFGNARDSKEQEDLANRLSIIEKLGAAGAKDTDEHPFKAMHGNYSQWMEHEMKKYGTVDDRFIDALRKLQPPKKPESPENPERDAVLARYVSPEKGQGLGQG